MKKLLSILTITSFLTNAVTVFASQEVKVTIGSKIANVNENTYTLNIAPYIQKPSDSMMIPLRFVSVGLGIDESNIQYEPFKKEITINYNGKIAKFIVGTDKLIINGEEFSMLINNLHSVYTEIKDGSTFIPLRSLEAAFGIKIDWEPNTKTAILKNEKVNNDTENSNLNIPVEETIESQNSNYIEELKNDDYTQEEIRIIEEEVVKLVNDERAKQGLQPLEIYEDLMSTARKKSQDMFDNNYFDHTSPTLGSFGDLIKSSNINFNWAWIGENIAMGQKDAQEVVDSWMNSEGHRANILKPDAKYIGVGFVAPYWTQQFMG